MTPGEVTLNFYSVLTSRFENVVRFHANFSWNIHLSATCIYEETYRLKVKVICQQV